jgi:hypothetical protein
MTQEWSQRLDVLEALDFLSTSVPPLGADGRDHRWPNLTEAVHWLIDDTGWDTRDPAEDVGRILQSGTEADAIRDVVAAVMGVHDRQGAEATDAAWYGDPAWTEVRRLASIAAEVLER